MRSLFRRAGSRLLPALLTALGVVLVTGGLLSYADPNTAGPAASASIEAPTSGFLDPSDPPVASPGDSVDPGGSPTRTVGPDGSPPASIVPDPTPTPTP